MKFDEGIALRDCNEFYECSMAEKNCFLLLRLLVLDHVVIDIQKLYVGCMLKHTEAAR